MSYHISNLGAINKHTKQYCCAKLANKKEQYICPECNKELIIKKGTKRVHHFAHYKDDNPCTYYNTPTETQIHKDAKLALKQILDNSIPLKITRKCYSCKSYIYDWDVPDLKNCNIEIEYRFDYKKSLKIADLAVLYKNDIYTIFEIYNSHITKDDTRPEPWFEFDAKTVLNRINKNSIELECIRKEECEECLQQQYIKELSTWLNIYGDKWNGDQNVLEIIVRKVLGQTDFNYEYCICCKGKCTRECMYKECKVSHLRFDFDAQFAFQANKELIDIFNQVLTKYVVIHSHKGGLEAYIIDKEDESQYNYYDINLCCYMKCVFPYNCKVDFSGEGTVNIIIKILKMIYYYLQSYKKMTKIELDYDSENPKILDYKYTSNEKDNNDVTNASTYRYIRKAKQKETKVKSYNVESILNDNNIEFTENNNIITIIHPHTKEKIRRSMITNKTYFQQEWTTSITLQDIVEWYKSTTSLCKENIYLQVPFSEKDIVKALGARWDTDKKKWYVINTSFNREKFSKWIK
jgi:hypothetical protein